METGTYRKLLESLVAEKDLNEATLNVYNLACECDRVRERVVENAKYLAGKFANYSQEASEGRIYGTTPLASSTCRDIEQDSAVYYALRPVLSNMLHAMFGKTLARLLDEFAQKAEAVEVAS